MPPASNPTLHPTPHTPHPCRLLKTWGGALVGDAWELPSHLLSQLERRRTVGLPPLEPLPPPITSRWEAGRHFTGGCCRAAACMLPASMLPSRLAGSVDQGTSQEVPSNNPYATMHDDWHGMA